MAQNTQGTQGGKGTQGGQKQGAQNQAGQHQTGQNQDARQQTTSQQGGFRSDYWRDQLRSEPYYQQGRAFEDYEPALRAGEEGRSRYAGQRFEDIENELRGEYERGQKERGGALGWSEGAGQAARAAWDRADLQSSDRDVQGTHVQAKGTQTKGTQSNMEQAGTRAQDPSTRGGTPTGKM